VGWASSGGTVNFINPTFPGSTVTFHDAEFLGRHGNVHSAMLRNTEVELTPEQLAVQVITVDSEPSQRLDQPASGRECRNGMTT
jgi:hypothetical protein